MVWDGGIQSGLCFGLCCVFALECVSICLKSQLRSCGLLGAAGWWWSCCSGRDRRGIRQSRGQCCRLGALLSSPWLFPAAVSCVACPCLSCPAGWLSGDRRGLGLALLAVASSFLLRISQNNYFVRFAHSDYAKKVLKIKHYRHFLKLPENLYHLSAFCVHIKPCVRLCRGSACPLRSMVALRVLWPGLPCARSCRSMPNLGRVLPCGAPAGSLLRFGCQGI